MKNNKKCILIADDETEIREILKMLLTGDDYHVIEAANGREALDLADEDVDLYILDVNMPVMTGFMAASELRKKTQSLRCTSSSMDSSLQNSQARSS